MAALAGDPAGIIKKIGAFLRAKRNDPGWVDVPDDLVASGLLTLGRMAVEAETVDPSRIAKPDSDGKRGILEVDGCHAQEPPHLSPGKYLFRHEQVLAAGEFLESEAARGIHRSRRG